MLDWVIANRRVVFAGKPTTGEVIAFLSGLDMASSYGLLRGFQEWLVVRLGTGYEFHWSALVRCLAAEIPLDTCHDSELSAEADLVAAVEVLNLAKEFVDYFDDRDLRRELYAEFSALRERDGLD